MPETVCLALTGASGLPYGLRLLECLLAAGCRVQLLYSQAAQVVARQEMDRNCGARRGPRPAARCRGRPKNCRFRREEGCAGLPLQPPDAVALPARWARGGMPGLSDNLIEAPPSRQKPRLALGPRETPLDDHLREQAALAAGAVILPPSASTASAGERVIVRFRRARYCHGGPHELRRRGGE
jgi:4-hydroxy-3-polyprenylbenzoate decarboxylase